MYTSYIRLVTYSLIANLLLYIIVVTISVNTYMYYCLSADRIMKCIFVDTVYSWTYCPLYFVSKLSVETLIY